VNDRVADVSIVVPAFNAERFIEETIDSVLAQTHRDWELVVVDDGSTDDTASVVQRVDDARIRLVQIPHSGLPAVARNRGIAESRAPHVAFLDADDLWRPEKLAHQLEMLAARPEVGLVHCAAEVLDDPQAPVATPGDDEEPLLIRLLETNFIYNSSVLVRRSVLDEHGVFDTDPGLRGTEDFELWLRLAVVVEFAYVPEPLLLYRVHTGGLSADQPRLQAAGVVALDKARARHPELIDDHPAFLRAVGIASCIAGLPGSGRRELFAYVRAEPRDRLAWKWLALSLLGSGGARRLGALRRRGLRLSWLVRRLRRRHSGAS
jgi:glycosyltransferase involved in cell wall biosynthesis